MSQSKKHKDKKQVNAPVEPIISVEKEKQGFSASLKSLNNILIAHKDAQELRDYRRMFYSLFFMFCVLFLL